MNNIELFVTNGVQCLAAFTHANLLNRKCLFSIEKHTQVKVSYYLLIYQKF